MVEDAGSVDAPERSRAAVWVAVGAATLFVLLAVLVATGVTDHVDDVARGWWRPHNVWGPTQLRADTVVEGLKPPYSILVLVGATLAAVLVRRSARPVLLGASLAAATLLLGVLTEVVVRRPDPHGVAGLAGSFPSGHVLVLTVSVGGAFLVLTRTSRPWHWVVTAVAGAVMGACLLVQAAHWTTDVVGGWLLAAAILATASTSRLRRPAGSREPVSLGEAGR